MISSILILVIAFASLIILMIIHEFGHFIIAKKFGVRVDEFGIGYPPRLYGKKIGETIYSINLLPLGAFVRIYGEEGGLDDYRSFTSLKIWQRVLIIIGGVAAFWIAAIIIFSVVFAIGTDLPVGDQDVQGLTNAQVKIISVSENSPAGQAGIKIADTIKAIKVAGVDTKINKVADFQKITQDNKGKEITITIERNGKTFDVNLTPRINPPAGQGSVGIGLERMATLIQKTAWYMAPVQGVIYTWQTTVNALKGLYVTLSGLIGGKGAPEGASFAGPLGITIFLANAASYGVGFFLYFIGMICVFIAIFNLFPIPALDGGKLVFLLIEKIKGKPVSVKVEQGITLVFFAILICLSLFITIKFDIPRFTDFLKSSLQK
ncbi:MAG: M50 family metallopeptidase [Candidatus Staskawiczbacteria bacterium]|nr:M50 family metallopeptidase [Candidatus Staskawiczbacteria bacterium]